ncbi:MAG: glycosyltransferase [Polyangiales bacterium]
MRPLHICSVITDLGFGGGESRVLAFAQGIDRARFRHTVVSLFGQSDAYDARWGSLRREFARHGADLVDLGEPPRERLLPSLTPAGVREGAPVIARMLRKLMALYRARGVDVVDAQHITASFFGTVSARLARLPVTVTEYHADYWERPGMRPLGKLVLGQTSALISDSEVRRGELAAWTWPRHPRSVVIPNGIPEPVATEPADVVRARFGVPAGARVVAQVSRLVPYKGHATLIEAAAQVLREVPEAYFLCVGFAGAEPDYPDRLRALAKDLGVADRVRVQGHPGPIGDLWQIVDVHAHASHFDSLPIAITEGMALGKPAVVTRVGGIPDMVTDGVTGRVVEPRDAGALASAIVGLLRDEGEARRLGEAARARWREGYTPAVMARRLEALFTELCAARR